MNRELKKLLVASVGDDLQYHFERLAREKNQLILENEALGRNLGHTAEQLERMSIQCDVWRSKFLASRCVCARLRACLRVVRVIVVLTFSFSLSVFIFYLVSVSFAIA